VEEVFVVVFMISLSPFFFLLFIHFLVLKVLLELVEAFVPEPLVFMHPPCYPPEWLTSKRYVNLTTLLLAFNESGSFEQLKMFRHSIESRVERFCDIEESRRSVR
jgi:hypothetical protein